MLFDRDEDGVLSFQELQVVMKSMGQRPSGGAGTSIVLTRVCNVPMTNLSVEEDLLAKVREVSEDYLYNTLEFNEFLQLMSKQQQLDFTQNDLVSSFK